MANGSTTPDDRADTSDHIVYFCSEIFNFSVISGALFILIFIISVIGNSLLLCVLVIYEDLKNVTNIFVLNLACSDLVFTVTLPLWATDHLHHWVFGDFFCKFITAAYFVGLYSSVILLTAMTVDRFITVVLHSWPSNPVWKKRGVVGACAAAWVISVAASLPDALKMKVVDDWNKKFYCEPSTDGSDVELGYYLQVSLLFFLPFAIIVFCYSAILKTVLQASIRRRHRTVVVVLCIVAAFFICWGPYNIILVIMTLYEPTDCKAEQRLDIAYHICRILAFSHCCMNPLLYMLSQKLRKHLWQLLHCGNIRRKSSMRSTGQNTSVGQTVAFTAQNSAVMMEMPNK
ncbi:chemokine XC receptor 1-like [Acanthochromis polyacanthus]|uniref:chemokine XC receptor 1-like n=1 Tax=Acanthochromis polyacanthus TaxID=80966 RepID=UPI002234B5E2|nr:chemokine XC receptor 1-like [Acanthochromis polyacanthus]